uniref:Putative PD-(D/E)XK nuclease superfamily protein n=1 Tax=viral metagenome TaxID=1070528 RepID=A0A6M3LEG0_9ZZZZ
MTLDHYSPSSVGMFDRCPRAWHYRYTEGIKTPPAAAMIVGSSVHTAQARHFGDVLDGAGGLDVDEYAVVAAEDYDRRAAEVDWAREDVDSGSHKDRAVYMARAHRQLIVPTVEDVAAVEHEIRLSPEAIDGLAAALRLETPICGPALVCILDVVDRPVGVTRVRDLKTRGKAPSGVTAYRKRGDPAALEVDTAHRIQLAAYKLADWARSRAKPLTSVDYVWAGKGGDAVSVPVELTDADLRLFLDDLRAMDRQVRAGLFPRRRNGWHCSDRACGYWDRCIGSVGTDL